MPSLPDGTVLPHYFSVESASDHEGPTNSFADTTLHLGEVVAVFPAGAKGNRFPDETEYIVMVEHREGSGAVVNTPYRCILATSFGGMGDSLRYSLRSATSEQKNGAIVDGSYVLIGCINGDPNAAVILAGIRHPKAPQDTTENERYLDFNFNGVNLSINDEGELLVRANGATLANGKPDENTRDENQKGTFVKFSKDGSFEVSDGQNSISTNPESKSLQIKTTGNCTTKTDEGWDVNATENSVLACSKDLFVRGARNLRLDGSTITLGSESANENLVLGQKLVEALGAFTDIWINNAATLSIGNLGAPTILFPSIVAQLQAWKMRYIQNLGPMPAQILARKKFTER